MDKTLSNMSICKKKACRTFITAMISKIQSLCSYEDTLALQLHSSNYLTPSSGVLATIIQTDPVRTLMSNRDFLSFGTLENLKNNGEMGIRLADDSYYENSQ